MLYLVPSEVCKPAAMEDFGEVIELYRDDLPSPEVFKQEYKRWQAMCRKLEELPSTLASAIKLCDSDIYPNIYIMLSIACTWPVTSCECERSFSGLRRLNTYLRAAQSSKRLDALAMMSIHRSMEIDVEHIVNLFAQLHPRRMELNILS